MYCPLDRSQPCPFPLSPTQTYLGEDEQGYYVMDGFFDGIGNMFKRMVKFTPKSFTPGNIWKGVRNTTLTTITGGVYLALPKSVKKTMENVANVAIPAVAGAAVAVAAGPAVMGMLGPKLSTVANVLGKNISSIGKGLFDVMGKLPQSKQAEIAQQVSANDILYSEQHNGQLPPHIMQLVDEANRASYGPAFSSIMNPTQTDPRQYYADSNLYPGLQQARLEQAQQAMQPQEQSGFSSGEVIGLVGAAVAVAVLVSKR